MEHASKPKHRARAVKAMAHEICVTEYTDGFCSPRDGICYGTERHNCMKAAEGCMRAMEGRGLMVVWPYDKDQG
jgi:hypothetical protein